jgi:hypothetical protein
MKSYCRIIRSVPDFIFKDRSLILCIIIYSVFSSCIDPFYPRTEDFQSLMVVDALVTDKNESYYCRLSRSIEKVRDTPEMIAGAAVTVTDDLGNSYIFKETSSGIYKSDSLSFRCVPGGTYTLHIVTKEGDIYESDPVTMPDVPAIDSLYYGKDKETDDDGLLHEGVRIYIDSKKPSEGNYLRWTYEEWWKTRIPFPPLFTFIDEFNIVPVLEPGKVICWRNDNSFEIITGVPDADPGTEFNKKPLTFIASDLAERLMVQYYIKIRQYAISKKEYQFWGQLEQIRKVGGDIFDRQPFQIISNIHNEARPGEEVLGYFQVSAVSEAAIYITRHEVDSLNLRQFDYGCERLYANPNYDFPGKPEKPVSVTQMYHILVDQGYVFVDYYSFEEPGMSYLIFVFVRDYCSDCTVTGNPNKPDFWVDIN